MTVFIITIDTEGDNIWSYPKNVTTRNAEFLPRFHDLCVRYAFKPTYLVNHEMAMDTRFQKLGRRVVESDSGEIGLHLHAWNSPPIFPQYDFGAHYYQYEIPDSVLLAKMESLTELLVSVFGVRPVSHRAGRWGFDARVAQALVKLGYLVDCSVAPGTSFKQDKGFTDGIGGPDFESFSVRPYMHDLEDIGRSGDSQLLQVPVTIKSNYGPFRNGLSRRLSRRLPRLALRALLGPAHSWLRPNGRNLPDMLKLVDWSLVQQLPVLEFMLHSSELMPGGSPKFTNEKRTETLYLHLEKLFDCIGSRGIKGATLAEYRSAWPAPASPAYVIP